MLNILVACEESQAITKEFRKLGHNAFSCDIQPCSGGHPEWHIKFDCKEIIFFVKYLLFKTMDKKFHYINKWDLVIAHPPCTYLARVSNRLLDVQKYGKYAENRLREREKAIEFFKWFTTIECEHVAIENPIGCMSTLYRSPDQIIQPWMFGDAVQKSTCLWLKGLPELIPDTVDKPEIEQIFYTTSDGQQRSMQPFFYNTRFLPAEERRRERSKTFPGIAKAIAQQWSAYLENN